MNRRSFVLALTAGLISPVYGINAITSQSKRRVITDSDDLVVGKYYALTTKPVRYANGSMSTPETSWRKCQSLESDAVKYFNTGCRFWTDNSNPQGFNHWDIYGPYNLDELPNGVIPYPDWNERQEWDRLSFMRLSHGS